MTWVVSPALSPALVQRFSQRDLERRLGVAMPFVTQDARGRPHPMLISYLELRAYDSRSLGLVIQGESASARNLVERAVGTLIVVEPDLIAYVLTRLVDGPLPVTAADAPGLAYFLLEIEEVREDSAAAWEAGMGVVESIRYAPLPTLAEPWARATIAALASARARA